MNFIIIRILIFYRSIIRRLYIFIILEFIFQHIYYQIKLEEFYSKSKIFKSVQSYKYDKKKSYSYDWKFSRIKLDPIIRKNLLLLYFLWKDPPMQFSKSFMK